MSGAKCIICGMIINEKNYDFNKYAFINKNRIDEIKFCPFCGASHEFIVNEGETIQENINMLDEIVFKILDHAVKLEVFNGDFYKKASRLAKDEKIKNMFDALGNIEVMHARIHKALGGFDKLPELRDMDYSKYDSDDILLDMAKRREEHAVEYYRKYVKDVKSERIKTIFRALSEVEMEHIILATR